MPVIFMALVLVAWQYRWRHVVFFSVGFTLFSLGLHGLFERPGGPSILPVLTISIVQMVSFLIVGYFISALMYRFREQQQALESSHRQVLHYASTLERLTVSRERNRMAPRTSRYAGPHAQRDERTVGDGEGLLRRRTRHRPGAARAGVGSQSLWPSGDAPGAQIAAGQPAR